MKYTLAIEQDAHTTGVGLYDENEHCIGSVSLQQDHQSSLDSCLQLIPEDLIRNIYAGIREILFVSNIAPEEIKSVTFANIPGLLLVWDARNGRSLYPLVFPNENQACDGFVPLLEYPDGDWLKARTGCVGALSTGAALVAYALKHVPDVTVASESGFMRVGSLDSWLIWHLTDGKVHSCDLTNAARTQLFNIHQLEWDTDLCAFFGIPVHALPKVQMSDAVFGETTLNGLLSASVPIAGISSMDGARFLGHGSWMRGLVSLHLDRCVELSLHAGYASNCVLSKVNNTLLYTAGGDVCYGYSQKVFALDGLLRWLSTQLNVFHTLTEADQMARNVRDSGGVFCYPEMSTGETMVYGLRLDSTRFHLVRSCFESVAYTIKQLLDAWTEQLGVEVSGISVDGTVQDLAFLMQYMADLFQCPVTCFRHVHAVSDGLIRLNALALGKYANLNGHAMHRLPGEMFLPNKSNKMAQEQFERWKGKRGFVDKNN